MYNLHTTLTIRIIENSIPVLLQHVYDEKAYRMQASYSPARNATKANVHAYGFGNIAHVFRFLMKYLE